MEWLILVGIIILLGSFVEGSNVQSKRTKRLDPGGRNDFGGRL